jgi:nicotinamide mononucleotide transporter
VRVLDWLISPAMHLAGTPVTWSELLGFVTGVVNVWLLVIQRPLNWAPDPQVPA